MRRVRVAWANPIPYPDLSKWLSDYEEYLYAVVKRGRILYVGMAYSEYVDERLATSTKLRHIADKEGETELNIVFGRVVPGAGRRISKLLIQDIENLLITVMKPKYNTHLKENYLGRDLTVANGGGGNPFPNTLSTNMLDD